MSPTDALIGLNAIPQRWPARRGYVRGLGVDSDVLQYPLDSCVPSVTKAIRRICPPHFGATPCWASPACLHQDIADKVIAMVQGAAQELVAGDPSDLATDVGPVIDADAYEGINRHLLRLQREAHQFVGNQPVAKAASSPNAINTVANLIAPQAFEVSSIADLKAEIFGPVLHVVSWRGDALAVVEQINALGFGLTLGIQTRIASRAQQLAHAAHIGNVYINRNQIGAVVGVQPFGFEACRAPARRRVGRITWTVFAPSKPDVAQSDVT